MMENGMEHKEIDQKDMAKAKEHVMALEAICAKSGCSVEHLVEMVTDQEGEAESEDMGEGEGENGMDKGKVALIIAKMKGAKGEE